VNYRRREYTDLIVVHCAATKPHQDIGVAEIRRWHMDPNYPGGPFGDIGYHYVIRRSGRFEVGRPEWAIGAHVAGSNRRSVGLCLVGGVDAENRPCFNYTRAQMDTLEAMLITLKESYVDSDIIGHRDVPGVTKACPCFDVRAWWDA
jgi:hypothetical protein